MNSVLLEQIASYSGRLEKERLIATMDEDTRRVVSLALDPNITFGVTTDEDEEYYVEHWHTNHHADLEHPAETFWTLCEELAGKLAARTLTGNAAKYAVEELLHRAPSPVDAIWACRFFNRNLRAGFDIRTLNKIFEGSVEKFSVQLAETYEPDMELVGEWLYQPKLDGNRVTFVDGKAMSRNGKEYPNCGHVVDELTAKDPDFFKKWVLDGEMMGDLGFDQSSGALRRFSQKDRKKAKFTYWCFDIIDRNQWAVMKTQPLRARMTNLTEVLGKKILEGDVKTIKLVPWGILKDPSHSALMALCKEYVAQGFEGAMVKDLDSPYVFKRGRNLLKVKLFKDVDLQIIDFYEGKGKHKGRLGGIVVAGVAEGQETETKVGSGFDDPTRNLVWENKADWLGATVQIQYQDIGSRGALRFPVFIMRRKDKE